MGKMYSSETAPSVWDAIFRKPLHWTTAPPQHPNRLLAWPSYVAAQRACARAPRGLVNQPMIAANRATCPRRSAASYA